MGRGRRTRCGHATFRWRGGRPPRTRAARLCARRSLGKPGCTRRSAGGCRGYSVPLARRQGAPRGSAPTATLAATRWGWTCRPRSLRHRAGRAGRAANRRSRHPRSALAEPTKRRRSSRGPPLPRPSSGRLRPRPRAATVRGCSPPRSAFVYSPAIAPRVSPLATYFCKKGNKISIGRTDTSEPMITSG